MPVGIQFWSYGKWSKKHYTYHCQLDVSVGDLVVVDARGEPAIVRVGSLDAEATVNDGITYKQVRAKLPPLLPTIMADDIADEIEDRLRKQIEEEYGDE